MSFETLKKPTHILFLATLISLASWQFVGASFTDYPVHSNKWTNEYDRYFKKYSKRYFGPLFDWHWFKAQAIAESTLDQNAQSHVGAVGIMQIMPDTFADITKENPQFSQLESPKWNIAAGIYYNRSIYRKITNAPTQDKLYMTFASYNAGYGRLLNASKRVGKKEKDWDEIKLHLPRETRGYVKRIRILMGEI